jgi:class 3 adenylate cyclase
VARFRLGVALAGDPSSQSIEVRLFRITCLIMIIWVVYDLIQIPLLASRYTNVLELSYAIFLAAGIFCYLYSRLGGDYRKLITIPWALFFMTFAETWFLQAGSLGTVAFAMFPSMTVYLIVTPHQLAKRFLVLLIPLFVTGLILLAQLQPSLVVPYASAQDRLTDYLATVVSSFLVMGIVVVYYVGNYRRTADSLAIEKRKIETITSTLRKYLPTQLVETISEGTPGVATKPQRRRITVFFSDIKDFTPQTDALQPEDLTNLLNEYLTEMTLIATKWGGTIDKFIGDAMMVIFGAPISKDEKQDGLNCVQMAIEMQTKMKELQKKWYATGLENPLEIRVGIHTGVATVGDFGASERLSYTAIGGEVNLAARLQALASPGGIVISHPTWALVNEKVNCRKREDKVTVKGIGREFTIYDVAF